MPEPTIKLSDFDAARKAAGLYNRNELDYFNKFFRFGYLDPYRTLLNTKEYLFFTKPDFHLFADSTGSALNPEIASDPFYMDCFKRYKPVMQCLTKSLKGSRSPFLNVLSAKVNSNLELPSIVADPIETAATAYGTQIKYQISTITSDQNYDFSLEFNDDKELNIYYLFKIWNSYVGDKGVVSPINDNYVLNKILHDQICIYKFIVDDDGETILFFAKLFGVWPKNVPRDTFGTLSKDGGLSYSINFNATFVVDSNPAFLVNFNDLVKPYITGKDDIPLYDKNNNCINGEPCNMPYIAYDPTPLLSPKGQYKLKWR